jgi:hypothetical protein
LPSHALRLQLMMQQYRKARTFGVLENKLLCASLMSKVGMPTMELIYGAFAYSALGEWPQYERGAISAALRAGGYGPRKPFVIKPASDGTNYGLLLMTPERWKRENWTDALVHRHVERFLFKERSSWGQWYEQRGVLVQPLYTDDAPRGHQWPHGMAEMNVLAHLGRAVHMRVYEIPKVRHARPRRASERRLKPPPPHEPPHCLAGARQQLLRRHAPRERLTPLPQHLQLPAPQRGVRELLWRACAPRGPDALRPPHHPRRRRAVRRGSRCTSDLGEGH